MIEAAVRRHRGIREAAVVRDETGALAAFVRWSDEYLRDELGFEADDALAVSKWQKAYDLSQRTKEAREATTGFNTVGWISSYTRQPIPSAEMREWVDTTVNDILRFRPRRVYEIGCGSGLLLTRIAPKCDWYCGCDFAPAVLDRLLEQLRVLPSIGDRVRIEQRAADDFSGFTENSVDTVVISSVVQYFPSAAYLTRVLDRAARLVRPGGRIYVGDVRSLPLFPVFASSVELFRASDEMTVGGLRDLIRKRIGREQELLASPAYFRLLSRQIAKIVGVEIRPLRGNAVNEMSGYRYQAILHIGAEKTAIRETEFSNWSDGRLSLKKICDLLQARPDTAMGIANVPNVRVEKDVLAANVLGVVDPASSVRSVRQRIADCSLAGINPEDLFSLAERLNFQIQLSWSSCRPDGSFDACFLPRDLVEQQQPPFIDWPVADASASVYLTSAPRAGKHRSELIARLRDHCIDNLPAEMVPATFSFVDRIPEVHGDPDASALLAAQRASNWL